MGRIFCVDVHMRLARGSASKHGRKAWVLSFQIW